MVKIIKKTYKSVLKWWSTILKGNYHLNPKPYTLNKGAILVIALWLVSLLAIFGIGLARLTWSSYYFSRWQVNTFYSRIISDSVVLLCKRDREKDSTPQYDVLSELFNNEIFECGEFEGRYSLVDEERKLNINKVSSTVLEDIQSMNRSKVKEIAEYRNRPISPMEELLLVDEIEPEDYDKINDIMTVYGNGAVNINTCSEDTLERLDLTDSMIDDIMDFRKGYDGYLFTDDDGIFDSVGTIVSTLTDEYHFSMREQQTLASLISKRTFCVKSENFRILLDIYKNDKLISQYSIVIGENRKERKWEIKEWNRT